MQRPKSCRWTAKSRDGSIACMDEDTRERIIVVCTEAAMMMEDLSVTALGVASIKPDELGELVRELRNDPMAVLDILERT